MEYRDSLSCSSNSASRGTCSSLLQNILFRISSQMNFMFGISVSAAWSTCSSLYVLEAFAFSCEDRQESAYDIIVIIYRWFTLIFLYMFAVPMWPHLAHATPCSWWCLQTSHKGGLESVSMANAAPLGRQDRQDRPTD